MRPQRCETLAGPADAVRLSHRSHIPLLVAETVTPRWNFHKYLIAPDGTLIGAWPSRVPPTSDEIIDLIEETLPG